MKRLWPSGTFKHPHPKLTFIDVGGRYLVATNRDVSDPAEESRVTGFALRSLGIRDFESESPKPKLTFIDVCGRYWVATDQDVSDPVEESRVIAFAASTLGIRDFETETPPAGTPSTILVTRFGPAGQDTAHSQPMGSRIRLAARQQPVLQHPQQPLDSVLTAGSTEAGAQLGGTSLADMETQPGVLENLLGGQSEARAVQLAEPTLNMMLEQANASGQSPMMPFVESVAETALDSNSSKDTDIVDLTDTLPAVEVAIGS